MPIALFEIGYWSINHCKINKIPTVTYNKTLCVVDRYIENVLDIKYIL